MASALGQVAGPQVGYLFPQFFLELELSGAGFATRGAAFPGVPAHLDAVQIERSLRGGWTCMQ